MARLAKILFLILEGIIENIYYEPLAYESVDNGNMSLVISRKFNGIRIQRVKG